MNIVIIGCGDVGIRCAKLLQASGHSVTGVRRNTAALPDWLPGQKADVTDIDGLAFLSEVPVDIVIYVLAAAAFNESDYRCAYVTGVENTLDALQSNSVPLKRFIFVSSTGVYHQNGGETVDELSATVPVNFNGKVVLQGESLVRETPAGTCVRFSGIYGPDRLRMINRVAAGQGRGDSTALSNRIHVEDCAGVLAHLVEQVAMGKALHDLYLASDSCPATTLDVESFIAQTMGLTIPQTPVATSPTAVRRIAGSKWCDNSRLIDSGYQFIYPDYKTGYLQIIQGLRQKGG